MRLFLHIIAALIIVVTVYADDRFDFMYELDEPWLDRNPPKSTELPRQKPTRKYGNKLSASVTI